MTRSPLFVVQRRILARRETSTRLSSDWNHTAAAALLDKTARPGDRFRLLGIHGTKLETQGRAQLGLWER